MKKQIKKLTSIMFAISLILCIIGCKKEPEFNILDYVYTVSFESNGGTEIDSQIVVLGETVEKPVDPVHKEKPETEKFAGWYTDKGQVYDFSTKVESSFTLYAKWRHEHSLGETTIEPTCTQKGKKTVYCTVCEYEKEETIPAKGHTYGTWKVTTEPTTTQEGKNEKKCSNCGYVVDSVVLQPAPQGFVFVKGATVTGALPAWLDESASDYYKGVFIEGRTVTLSDFYMGKYEVTQEEYASVMAGQKVTLNGTEYALESNPSWCTKDSEEYTLFNGDVQEKRPVEGVTWYDAVWYCNALSEKKSLTKAYNIEVTQVGKWSGKTGYYIFSANVTLNTKANGYRLPTEAEWEYAARGGDPTVADWNYVFSGADTAEDVSYSSLKNAGLDSVGWYKYNSINGTTGDTSPSSGEQGYGTHQVGKKAPNRLGLYDMSGNVYEWCYDWYGTVSTGEETEPTGAASGSGRVLRGGSWYNYADDASVSSRLNGNPYYRDDVLGFRVVRPRSN